MDNGNNALNRVVSTDSDKTREKLTHGFAANDPKNDFRSKNPFVGLDTATFSEQERNMVAVELARMGANIGFELTGYIVEHRAGRLAENVKGDVERALKKKTMWDRFLALMAYYDAMYNEALKMLDAMFEYVDDRIAEIDAEIEAYKNDTIEHNFNSSSEADEHVRQLEVEKAELKRIKAEELEAHKEQLVADAILPNLDHLMDISEQITQATTSHTSTSNNSATSKSRMAQLMARYKSTPAKSSGHSDDETEKPQLPAL